MFGQLLTTVSGTPPGAVRVRNHERFAPFGLKPRCQLAFTITAESSGSTVMTLEDGSVPAGAPGARVCCTSLTLEEPRSTPAAGVCGTTWMALNGDSSTCWNCPRPTE